MAYDDTLPDDENWVRFLTDDTTATPINSDGEITAVLAEIVAIGSAKKYSAAAWCLARILTKYQKKGEGLTKKQVDDLHLQYGSITRVLEETLQFRINDLKRETAKRMKSKPRMMQTVRPPALAGEGSKITDRLI